MHSLSFLEDSIRGDGQRQERDGLGSNNTGHGITAGIRSSVEVPNEMDGNVCCRNSVGHE